MGTYRFVLALAVVVGHTGFAPDAFGLGVCAVVSFLILSGYVMTLLAERYYASPDRVLLFYLDRAGRIFPQFLFYLTITIVLVNQHRIGFGFASSCSSGDALYNALALPLSWSRLIGIDCQYLPQAWSVGLELSFYLAVPWLLWSVRLSRCAAALSLIVFGAALLGVIDADTYGYRTLPGTLFMFMVGMSFARPALLGRWFPYLVWVAALACLALRLGNGPTGDRIEVDVLIGLVVGVPLVDLLRRWRAGAVDAWLGNLSYGLFLNHLLVLNLMQQIAGIAVDNPVALAAMIVISTSASLVSYRLIERPIVQLRRALRGAPVATAAPLRSLADDLAA